MVRSYPRSLFWLSFALATLWLALIAAPRRVSGQDFSSPSRSDFSPRSVPVDVLSVDPAPPEFTPPPAPRMQAAPPAIFGTASSPNYWIVSSRSDIQHRKHLHLDDGELDVYQRTPDGRLCPTNLASLQSQIIPGVPVLICIHGVFVRWQDECLESHQAYQWIRNACPHLPLQVIFFSWPSDGMITGLIAVDVNIRSNQAEFNSLHVARLIHGIPESCPVSFIGHSLGCRTILSTLHLAGGGEVQGMSCPGGLGANRRFRAVFAAAAVDHNWLNPRDRYGCALPRTECIVNLQNRKDLPLAFYPFYRPFAGRAIARSGLTRRDTRKLGPQSEKFINLDITQTQGCNHLWPGYFRCREIAAAIAPIIYYPGVAQHSDTPAYEMPSAPQTEHRLALTSSRSHAVGSSSKVVPIVGQRGQREREPAIERTHPPDGRSGHHGAVFLFEHTISPATVPHPGSPTPAASGRSPFGTAGHLRDSPWWASGTGCAPPRTD